MCFYLTLIFLEMSYIKRLYIYGFAVPVVLLIEFLFLVFHVPRAKDHSGEKRKLSFVILLERGERLTGRR